MKKINEPYLMKIMITTDLKTQTQVGIGYSREENSYVAGVEIATKAVMRADLRTETLFLLFATPQHKTDELIAGVRSVVGHKPEILGCTTTGLVTNDFISYTGVLAGGGFVSSNTSFFNLLFEDNIKDREYEAGISLAKKLKEAGVKEDAGLLMFYDSIKVTSTEGQPSISMATPILEGFFAQNRSWPTVAGIGAWGDVNAAYPCAVWANNESRRHGMAAATIAGPIKMDSIIMHGTRPVGGYRIITRAEQNIVYELDGRPALDVIDDILGSSVPWEAYPLLIMLGVNNGDKFGEFKEENYASRLCLAIDKEAKALIMFENDLKEGSEVQLMQRNIDFKYIKPQVDKLLSKAGNRKPVFAFYIDCLGRVSGYSGLPEEESLEVMRALGNLPFFGLFSGVEIANVGPSVKALDWTGVLCLFSEA